MTGQHAEAGPRVLEFSHAEPAHRPVDRRADCHWTVPHVLYRRANGAR